MYLLCSQPLAAMLTVSRTQPVHLGQGKIFVPIPNVRGSFEAVIWTLKCHNFQAVWRIYRVL